MNQIVEEVEYILCDLFFKVMKFTNNIIYNSFGIINVMLLAIVISLAFIIDKKNKKQRLFNKELFWYYLKMNFLKSLIIISTSLSVANFINVYKYKVISYFYNGYLAITIIIISLYYLFSYKPVTSNSKRLYNSEIFYCKFINEYLYFILMISSFYGIQYIIANLMGIFLVNEWIIYIQLYREEVQKNENIIDLYETRKKQLSDFENILNNEQNENYAVALNGEWGSGKTTFLNEYMKRNKESKFFIYIKPMVTDNMSSLLQQIAEQLNNIMITNGFNIGIDNLIKSYSRTILKVIGDKTGFSIKEYFNIDKFDNTYIGLKKQLQNSINELYEKTNKKKKIIFIVDDFDRVSENKQETILDFIKEIVNFDNTITIFAFDYKKISKNDNINHEYLEKFVSYEVDLAKVELKEIINYNINDIGRILKNPKYEIVDISKQIKENIISEFHRFLIINESRYGTAPEDIKEEDYKKINEMKKKKWSDLIQNMKNSRRIKQFFDSINLTLDILNRKEYLVSEIGLDVLCISEIIIIMNFLKIFDKDTYLKIIEFRSVDDYIEFWKEKCNFINNNFVYRMMNKEIPKREYNEQSINAEVESWYIENITKKMLESTDINYNDKEVMKKAKLRIINDLFIDYNADGKDIDIRTMKDELLRNIDIAIKDKRFEIFDYDMDIFMQLKNYEDAIFSKTIMDCEMKERIKYFARKNVELFLNGRINITTCLSSILQSRSIESAILYCITFTDNMPGNVEVDKQEKSTVIYYINEARRNNIRKYYDNFICALLLLSNNSKVSLDNMYTHLGGLFDENTFLNKTISVMNDNNIKFQQIESLEQLADFMKENIQKKYNSKNTITNIDLIIKNLEMFIDNKRYLDNLIKILDKTLSENRRFIDIKSMNINQLINFIINISNKNEIDRTDANNFCCALFWIINKLQNDDGNIINNKRNKLIDECKKLYNDIVKKNLAEDKMILSTSVNIQWLIDNYGTEED